MFILKYKKNRFQQIKGSIISYRAKQNKQINKKQSKECKDDFDFNLKKIFIIISYKSVNQKLKID